MKSTTGTTVHNWSSVAEIKAAHRELLQSSEGMTPQGPMADKIRDFIVGAAAAGRWLAKPGERAEAQKLINYWVASLPGCGANQRLRARETILVPYDSSREEKIVNALDLLLLSLSPEGQCALKRIFLKLIRLDSDGVSFSPVSWTEEELLSGLDSDQARPVLMKLLDIGVVVREPESNRISFVGISMFGRWETGDQWLSQRRRFRDAARFWRSHGEHPGALLSRGELLNEAYSYHDLNAEEMAFAQKSRATAETRFRNRLISAGVVLCFLLVSLMVNLWQVKKEGEMEKARAAALLEANTKLLHANDELQIANKRRDAAIQELEGRNKELEGVRLDLAAQVAEWKTQMENARSNLVRNQAMTAELLRLSELAPHVRTSLKSLSNSIHTQLESVRPDVSTESSTNIVTPGAGIIVKGKESTLAGSAGVFVWDPATETRYLVAPNYLISRDDEAQVYSGGAIGKSGEAERPLATAYKDNVFQMMAGNPDELSLIKVSDNAQVENVVSGFGEFKGHAQLQDAVAGAEVMLIRQGAPVRKGRILGYDSTKGVIRTTKISQAGDAGAPVVTADGKALGILIGSYGKDESLVKPLDPFLKTNKLKLLPAGMK